MERTVAVIKPGAVKRKKVCGILSQIESNNLFTILDMKMVHLSRLQAEVFYEEHRGKPFFEAVIEHAISGPCIGLLLEGDDAIQRWRSMMGPADRNKQTIYHIRHWHGLAEGVDNAVHGSDSPQAVEIEAGILGLKDPKEALSRRLVVELATLRSGRSDTPHAQEAATAPFVPAPWGEPGGGSFEEKLLPSDHPNAEDLVLVAQGEVLPKPQAKFVRLDPKAILPKRAHDDEALGREDVGFDLYASQDCYIPRGCIVKVPIGWRCQPPAGYELQVRTRSSMGLKGVFVVNGPGTIDPNFSGEMFVILGNIGSESYKVSAGDRIAQLVPRKLDPCACVEVDESELVTTARGQGGYGSSGR